MENIIPRWEWRTFGETFGESDDRFAALEPGGGQESDELYLLSPSTDENVKIRDLLMDIKTLEQVNPDGLEQWKPVMKGAFPLPAAVGTCRLHARAVRDGTGRAGPALACGEGTQATDPLQDRWLHVRGDRGGGGRQEDTHGRDRI
jgi:hypothetical protein